MSHRSPSSSTSSACASAIRHRSAPRSATGPTASPTSAHGPGPLVLHHSAFFEPSRQRLERHEVVTLDVPSTPERMTPAATTLMQVVTSGALVHDGDRELERQVARVAATQRPTGWAIESGTCEPIVATHAAMLAVHWAMTSATPVSRRVRGL